MLRLFVILTLFASPATASELWCMPDTMCRDETCRATTDEESSIRLHDAGTATPTLRSSAEDIPLRRTHEGDVIQWEGVNEHGGAELLAVRTANGAFVYRVKPMNDTVVFTRRGTCEVQP